MCVYTGDIVTSIGFHRDVSCWQAFSKPAWEILSLHVRAGTNEAMYATMGYIVPEYFKFPGYLSPSLGLKFSDVPNGLAALSKLPSQLAVFV